MWPWWRIWAGLLMVLGVHAVAAAHDARPISFDLTLAPDGSAQAALRVPDAISPDYLPVPVLPGSCTQTARSPVVSRAGSHAYSVTFACSGTLDDAEVGLDFPAYNPSLSTFFQVRLADGEETSRLILPGETRWALPTPNTFLAVAGQYTWLGITHILAGFDHLLFVLCLLAIAGGWRRILLTVTGFTVAHSLTLALSVLGVVRVSTSAIEALIALSIVLLAAEILRGRTESLLWRNPILVASAFGLLHGFGFASVLADLGVPQTYRLQALAFFNIGVEMGQIAFIAGTLLALKAAARAAERLPVLPRIASLFRPAFYVVGGIAAFWFVERTASVFA